MADFDRGEGNVEVGKRGSTAWRRRAMATACVLAMAACGARRPTMTSNVVQPPPRRASAVDSMPSDWSRYYFPWNDRGIGRAIRIARGPASTQWFGYGLRFELEGDSLRWTFGFPDWTSPAARRFGAGVLIMNGTGALAVADAFLAPMRTTTWLPPGRQVTQSRGGPESPGRIVVELDDHSFWIDNGTGPPRPIRPPGPASMWAITFGDELFGAFIDSAGSVHVTTDSGGSWFDANLVGARSLEQASPPDGEIYALAADHRWRLPRSRDAPPVAVAHPPMGTAGPVAILTREPWPPVILGDRVLGPLSIAASGFALDDDTLVVPDQRMGWPVPRRSARSCGLFYVEGNTFMWVAAPGGTPRRVDAPGDACELFPWGTRVAAACRSQNSELTAVFAWTAHDGWQRLRDLRRASEPTAAPDGSSLLVHGSCDVETTSPPSSGSLCFYDGAAWRPLQVPPLSQVRGLRGHRVLLRRWGSGVPEGDASEWAVWSVDTGVVRAIRVARRGVNMLRLEFVDERWVAGYARGADGSVIVAGDPDAALQVHDAPGTLGSVAFADRRHGVASDTMGDSRWWTTDGGRRWVSFIAPPLRPHEMIDADPARCTARMCQLGRAFIFAPPGVIADRWRRP